MTKKTLSHDLGVVDTIRLHKVLAAKEAILRGGYTIDQEGMAVIRMTRKAIGETRKPPVAQSNEGYGNLGYGDFDA